jgi:methylglyoxal synthase
MKIKICNAATLVELRNFDLAAAIRVQGECFVGRSPDVSLVLDSDDVSRQHGKFYLQDGKYYFCDLGSSNGSVINDDIIEPNRPYSLNNGDAVHIGDFVLLVEEPPQELAQTVFKVIDPWMFKPKPPEIVVSNPATEVQLPLVADSGMANTVETSNPFAEVAEIESIDLIEVADESIPNIELATPFKSIDKPIVRAEYSADPVLAEVAEIESIDLIKVADESIPNIELATPFDSIDEPIVRAEYSVEAVAIEPPIDSVNDDNLIANIELEVLPFDPSTQTIVQRGYLEIPSVVAAEDLSRNVEEYIPALTISDAIAYESVDLDEINLQDLQDDTPAELSASSIAEVAEISSKFTFAEPVENAGILLDEDIDIDPEIDDLSQVEAIGIAAVETEVNTPSIESELQPIASEEISFDLDDDELDNLPTIEALEIVDPIAPDTENTPEIENTLQVEDAEISLDDEDLTPQIDNLNRVAEVDNSTVEIAETAPSIDSNLQAGIVAGIATVAAVSNFDRPEATAQSNVIEEEIMPTETASSIDAVRQSAIDSLSTKQIIVICHESITPDLIDFIDEHKSFFAKCSLVSWLSISQELNQQTGINLTQAIPPGMSGGYQRIAASINSGEVAAVIFLRDFLQPQAGQTNEESMLRLCNINQILLATNTATASAIVSYLS